MNRMTYSLLTAFSLSLAGCGGSGQNTAALDAASGPVAVGAPTQLDFSAAVGDASASGNNTPPATVAMDSTSVSDGAALVPQLAASVTVVDGPSGQIASDYVLKFSEDFNAPLDAARWNKHIWYEADNPTTNYKVENGALKMWPQTDASGKFFNRTLDTDGHYTQTYGFFEIEARLPKGKGTQPAFWLLNHDAAKRPEIDIMKAMPGAAGWGSLGSDNVWRPTAYGPASWIDGNQQAGFSLIKTTDLSASFHKYGLRWEKNKQTFYLDGKEVYSVNVTQATPMYILLDLWFGGAAGTPDASLSTGAGNAFEVNYVKTWQFKSGTGMAPIPAPAPVPVPAPAPTPTPAPAPAPSTDVMAPFGQDASRYTLSFSEEFNGPLNSARWNDKIWYEAAPATKNYTVENGSLKIWPERDANGKFFNRTIDTDGKYYQTYGYFEIQAKLPKGKGTWPAFWLFNHIGNRRPEIDVMEAYAGGPTPWGKIVNGVSVPTMYASTIWQDATVQAGMVKVPTDDLSADFHRYGLKWEPSKLTFYFDGKQVYELAVTFNDPMYLMLDLWFGSASGTPDNSTPTGKGNSYEVNYLRAWKLK